MLINFKFKNFRSFKNETVLSMQATKDDSFKGLNTFFVKDGLLPADENELLKSVVLYGPNASGKSNVLKGLRYMQSAVILSSIIIPRSKIQENETFAFCADCEKKDSMYEVDFIQNDVFYRYGFVVNDGKVVKEYLFKRVERLVNVFDREQNSIELNGVSKEATKLIRLDSRTLFLSIARIYVLSPDLMKAILDTMTWFEKLLIVFEETVNSFSMYEQNNNKYRNEALQIMKMADLGIKDFKVYREDITAPDFGFNSLLQIEQNSNGLKKIDLKTIFNVYDEHGKQVGEKEYLMLRQSDFNSEGTKKLMFYLGWILHSLDEGRVLLLDELDSKLHLLLADYILKSYNSISKNMKNAQLISTAHNLMLMDGDMRRDQIYFTAKNEIGISSLHSLSDYKNVRKNDLFSKKYLLGFYSSVPDFNRE
ncbi:MAG: hypothetical protein A2084_02120 [Tenericutes bacterium GWC2_39_45]|nr:MAG: hypothetical protein A2084_02120 [Tenericutes bacterium GWC2_39_45]HBG33553.1 hypothetical protein [Acholeplasmataceae bacterium]HCB66223.1 hypothetical protein [Acholeplasmataceae bacterium]